MKGIAITAGDPCGVGPEVILKTLPQHSRRHRVPLIILGDLAVFERAARALHQPLPRWRVVLPGTRWTPDSSITFVDYRTRGRYTPGRSSRQAGHASLAYLDGAIALWRVKRVDRLVTAPVTKWAIQRSEPTFIGQTEYLARAMRRQDVVMMFAAEKLRVVLLTRHLPFREVARAVTPRLIATTLRITADALRTQFHVPRPRLALCGLNPHAGEAGLFGDEERRVLLPVLRRLTTNDVVYEGPFASDGLFARILQDRTGRPDAVVCWYHDQGLIPFKLVARDRGCQVTLGLPIVRTSPDHGSALDIAGRGIANPGSMRYALDLAATLPGC